MSKTYVPKALRQKVASQTRYRCGYCLSSQKITGMAMDVEHITPKALGGATEENNLWLACSLCNAFKGFKISAIDPDTEKSVVLFNPRYQIWEDHFSWILAGEQIVGKTPVGRVTVTTLQLNRELLVEARRTWISVGLHPPKN